MSNSEKNVAVSKRWQELGEAEKLSWREKAKQHDRPALEDLTDCQRKKLIDATLSRIDQEVQISRNAMSKENIYNVNKLVCM